MMMLTACQVGLLLVLFSSGVPPVQSRCNVSPCEGQIPDILDAYALVEVEAGDVDNIAEAEMVLLEEKVLEAYNCEVNDDFLMLLNFTLLRDTQDYYSSKNPDVGLNSTTWVAKYQLSKNICQEGLFTGDDQEEGRLLQEHNDSAFLRSRTAEGGKLENSNARQTDDICECPPLARSDFLVDLNFLLQIEQENGNVENVAFVLNVTDMELVDADNNSTTPCQAESNSADSISNNTWSPSAVVLWRSDKDNFTEEDLENLCNLYAGLYNQLNALNNEFCDPGFRVVQTCKATVVDSTSVRAPDEDQHRELIDKFPVNERQLQDENYTEVPVITTTSAPSTSAAPTPSPSSAPTSLGADLFNLLFEIDGGCYLCESENGLFDDVDFRRSRQLEFGNTDVEEFAEDCWCPVGSEIRAPTKEEYVKLLNATGRVVSFTEVANQDCPVFTPFQSQEEFDFFGDLANLDQGVLDSVATIFLDTYEGVSEGFCDPTWKTIDTVWVGVISGGRLLMEFNASDESDLDFFHNMTESNETIMTVSPSPSLSPTRSPTQAPTQAPTSLGADLFTLAFRTTGVCAGCAADASLFDDITDVRVLASNEDLSSRSSSSGRVFIPPRRLNEDPSCFCEKGAVIQGISRDAFEVAFNEAIINSDEIPAEIIQSVALPTSFPTTTTEPSSSPTTSKPSSSPSSDPTQQPSSLPTSGPSNLPSNFPSEFPSHFPSEFPSEFPSDSPSESPSAVCGGNEVCLDSTATVVFLDDTGAVLTSGSIQFQKVSTDTPAGVDTPVGVDDCSFPDSMQLPGTPTVVKKFESSFTGFLLLKTCSSSRPAPFLRVYENNCGIQGQCNCLKASQPLGRCDGNNINRGRRDLQFDPNNSVINQSLQLIIPVVQGTVYFIEEYESNNADDPLISKCLFQATPIDNRGPLFAVRDILPLYLPTPVTEVKKCQNDEIPINLDNGVVSPVPSGTEGVLFIECKMGGIFRMYSGSCFDVDNDSCEASFICGTGVLGFNFEFDSTTDYWIYFEEVDVIGGCPGATEVQALDEAVPTSNIFFGTTPFATKPSLSLEAQACSFEIGDASTFVKIGPATNEGTLTIGCYGDQTQVEVFSCSSRTCYYSSLDGCPNDFNNGEVSFTVTGLDPNEDFYGVRYTFSEPPNQADNCPGTAVAITSEPPVALAIADLNLLSACTSWDAPFFGRFEIWDPSTYNGDVALATAPFKWTFTCSYTSDIVEVFYDSDALVAGADCQLGTTGDYCIYLNADGCMVGAQIAVVVPALPGTEGALFVWYGWSTPDAGGADPIN